MLFISHERLAQNASETDAAPLEAASAWVVEMLPPSKTPRSQQGKVARYTAVGVRQCWVVSPGKRSGVVLALTEEGAQEIATY